MRRLNFIAFFILLQPIVSFGQVINIDSAKTEYSYSNVRFEIINVDTVVTHFTNGEYNTPNYKQWDSTKIWADIILINFPAKFDSLSLKRKAEAIMKDKGINKAFVFRDIYSSMLFRMSSLIAAKKLKERDGYLGQFNRE